MFDLRNTATGKINFSAQLTGQKIILVPFQKINILKLYFFLKDKELISYAFGVKADTKTLKKTARRYLQELIFSRHQGLSIYTREKKFIGIINFKFYPEFLKIRIGIMIGDKNLWGKGLGTDALKTFIKFLFNSTKIETIELETAKFNLRAQSCFQKLGFSATSESASDSRTEGRSASEKKESGYISKEENSKIIMSLRRNIHISHKGNS